MTCKESYRTESSPLPFPFLLIGIDKVMVRTLRRINKLIEIAMLAYTISFKILMIGGKLVESIIKAGGKLGLKKKNEDTVGRILKGLANVVLLL